MKGGKKVVAKLDARIRELEGELELETRRHTDTQKHARSKERRLRELQFQVCLFLGDGDKIEHLCKKTV